MCGFCGVVEDKDNTPLVRRMCELLRHRGPDHASVYQQDSVCLGHRRLSIIDLFTGDQPIFNEDRTLTIVCNGEIYNYRELRAELTKQGHRFHTQSDTEPIVHLYEQYGLGLFDHLNGIFAFALYDATRKRLILGRDHFGVKPLHYWCKRGKLVFASEIKAILLHPDVERAVNHQSLHNHINLRYTQSNATLFKDISRLPPAHYLVFEHGALRTAPYYALEPRPDRSKDERDYPEQIRFYVEQAVKRQLVSDVPVGVSLSGGMDSSTIVAMMANAGVEQINTFTLGFNEPTDEFEDAQHIADRFGTRHHALRLSLEPMKRLAEVIWHAEEPKINLLQGFALSQFVSDHVKVVLGGLGGDELFAGYDIHQFVYPFNMPHRIVPACLEKALLTPASRGLYWLQHGTGLLKWDEWRRGAQMILATGNVPKFLLILRNVWDFDAPALKDVYTRSLAQDGFEPVLSEFQPYFDRVKQGSALDQALYVEFHTKMVNDYMLTEDRMSMAHAVEERVPFLDKDLVEFAFSIPSELKMKGNTTKYLLRKAMEPLLPPRILNKRKWGFAVNPYLQFQKDLKDTAQRILTRQFVEDQGIFNYDYIRAILESPPHPRMRWHYNFLWIVMGLAIWQEMFVETDRFKHRDVEIEGYYH